MQRCKVTMQNFLKCLLREGEQYGEVVWLLFFSKNEMSVRPNAKKNAFVLFKEIVLIHSQLCILKSKTKTEKKKKQKEKRLCPS